MVRHVQNRLHTSKSSRHASRTMGIVAISLIGTFLSMYGISGIPVAFPTWMNSFAIELPHAQWILTAFMIASGAIVPLAGDGVARFGARNCYVACLSGYGISTLFCATALTVDILIVARVLQGICAGLITPLSITIIYQYLPKERQAVTIGLWSTAAMLAPAVGPTVAGWLVDMFGWRSIFYTTAPLGFACAYAAYIVLPAQQTSLDKKPFDALGFMLSVGASMLLLVGLSQLTNKGSVNGMAIAACLMGAMLLAVFVRNGMRGVSPLLEWSLFRNAQFRNATIVSGGLTLSLYSTTYLMPLFLQQVQLLSATMTGLLLLAPSLIMVVLAPFVGRLYHVCGPRLLLIIGTSLMIFGTAMLCFVEKHTSYAIIIGWLAVRSIGVSFATVTANHAAMETLAVDEAGQASALSSWIRQLLSACSIAIYTTVYMNQHTAYFSQSAPTVAVSKAVHDAFIIAVLVIIAVVPLVFAIRRSKAYADNEAQAASTNERSM
ncbi:DHA2 family efflux MFS transporter permease subunit [Paenibacillus sp. 481]|uniref:DHA2 family efflux MFS transporter permease subunit n=1 Tax=Paenibacillus sp. 481 TaxID=2835869 RepID=UPI001E46961B|nr:DHA2 family efflux MFS transporter permease subunit [Paenibacillus sp. 481]UHA73049.1 DHA2 family efflux MFS transporter permease subunit [Paenibacillus sp. 481]